MHNAKYRETRGSSTVRQEHKAATHLAFEKNRFKGKAVNGNNWLGCVFQEQSFAKHKAAMEKAAREHDAEKRNVKKRLPEKFTNISAEKENPLKRGVPISQATDNKPTAVTSEKEDVGGRSLQQQTSSESESASPKTETSGLVDNTYAEKKGVKENGKVKGKMAMKEDKNHQAAKEEATKDATIHGKVVRDDATTDANNERVKVHCLCPWQCKNHSGAERRFVGKPRTSSCR